MSKKQKIEAAKKAFAEQEALRLQNLENAKTERLSEDDCTFVQMDERLHDQKFEHEPISFYKDAWLRFKQNKASIVAAAIILVIVLMAIFAPVFSGTSYREQHTEFGVLPPRIPYLENLGIADGGIVELSSRRGRITARAVVTGDSKCAVLVFKRLPYGFRVCRCHKQRRKHYCRHKKG